MSATTSDGADDLRTLIERKDWSATSLGPMDRWPKSLRTMLGVVLGSRFPMLLWWGPDLLHLYNDAYRPILRDKHPASLGAPAADVWAEVWSVAGPMARGVMEGGPATWTEDLQLFIDSGDLTEETFFTFSYSPVPDDDGRVGGILNTVQETTEKVRSERQVRMVAHLVSHTADATSAESARIGVMEVLGTNPNDVPFALYYALDRGQDGPAARLVYGAGWADPPERLTSALDLASATEPRVLHDVVTLLGPPPPGPRGVRPDRAMLLPLLHPGEPQAYGLIVAGVSPHRRLDERYLGFFRAVRDHAAGAVERARVYEMERTRSSALAEVDRAKTTFFSEVSHEFRTPLTLMVGPIEDALASPSRTLSGDELGMVHRNTLRLRRLVDTLLDFARMESGRADARFEPHDLAATTTLLASAFRSAVERTGVAFEVACPALPEPVWIDRDMWEKTVLNLLSNALKFTFEGRIRISLRWCGDHAELEVEDTGTGIPAHEIGRLFERFHRVRGARSRSHEGSGIGLALVHDVVRLHGGEVRVNSTVGRGSTFTVRLRRGHGHLPADRVVHEASSGARGEATATFVEEALRWDATNVPREVAVADEGEAHVLVVDDNADLREYIASLLRPIYPVEIAVDGEAALASARKRRPALVLSDVMMPRLDGCGLLRALRADASLRDVPVVLLSARAGEEATVEGLDAGADDYLAKPFAARELLARVRTHVELARQRETFERFFTLSRDMLGIAEKDGRLFRASPAFDALGHSREMLMSRPFSGLVHPDDRERTAAHLARLRASPTTVAYENRVRRADGTYRWLAWTLASDRSGTVYAVARDVTDARIAADALRAAKSAADDANRELEAFSYSVAHDLRAPLRAIDGFCLAVIEDHGDTLGEGGLRDLGHVRAQAQRMGRLIDDLLSLSRVARARIERTDLDLATIVRESAQSLRRLAPERRVELRVAPDLRARGDARLLAIVLDNLLSNAWKYTSKRAEAHVEVGAAMVGGQRTFFVRDDGAGFDMRYAGRLFGAFERLHGVHEFEGHGVGLATVRRIVERHGGRVWADASVGNGATFFFTLPEADSR